MHGGKVFLELIFVVAIVYIVYLQMKIHGSRVRNRKVRVGLIYYEKLKKVLGRAPTSDEFFQYLEDIGIELE